MPLGCNSEVQIAVQYARGGLPPYVRRRVHDYIAAHQIAGLSTAHFCAVFKQTEGNVAALLRAAISSAANPATSAQNLNVTGGNRANQSHCIQSFRKIVGVTPGDYRRCCLQDTVHSEGASEVSQTLQLF